MVAVGVIGCGVTGYFLTRNKLDANTNQETDKTNPIIKDETKPNQDVNKKPNDNKVEDDKNMEEETDSSGERPEDDSAESTEDTAGSGVVAESLQFAESEGLLRPVNGEVLIPFSMDSSVYFSTLDQFKYNPAMMIAAEQGTGVSACAEGVVVDIFEDEEIGHAVTMDLGNGYQITYGQLYDINVTMNSHVDPGQIIASVAAPTKYYSVEGSNLYLKLTANGTPVNPEALFR